MSLPEPRPLVAVDLDGGADPAAWVDAIVALDRAGVDIATFPDALAPRRSPELRAALGPDELDAVQLAAFLTTRTESIALLPSVNVTETEPFHISTAIATLDHLSRGRAGAVVRIGSRVERDNVGVGRPSPESGRDDDRWTQADDAVEVIRSLWDSWEDDAIIRDVATGRFIDRERLHAIDFTGARYSVRGPAITPRPPQGQVPIAVHVDDAASARWAAAHADVVFLDSQGTTGLRAILREDRPASAPPVRVIVDVAATDARVERTTAGGSTADAWVASIEQELRDGASGVRIRPEAGIRSVPAIVQEVLPRIEAAIRAAAGARAPAATTPAGQQLRQRLGLSRPGSRFHSNTEAVSS